MVLVAQLVGALLGLLAVVFGAFGAHLLKKTFTEDQLNSFETGVKYQMYHALLLLMLSFNLNLETGLEKAIIYCIIIGIILFSFSIYGLCISASKGNKIKILGPITPIGGLLLVTGWGLLFYNIVKNYI
ncbi:MULTISPECIES: DUF423 domain-containing protein [Maribacter]|uniref:Uncharacterized membrane protein YgdD, TMEM256/DUF423 family n=1 Tax=Maribacter dokdonensis TaxID=320912 RepID=A0A1H4LQZ3_9FLAO|nr:MULTISPECIES: DUF423 domain-containing protein [Maribacter]HAF78706.1 DUF423 domain-containing protein [Maribacter sp.]KSA12583.1 hypothetical protein I600_2016 [Maribacter dokdonensis DSW-8]MBU2900343.1 DUF423 domain-containing protein [Maribacter dokdonensis]PHN94741.1 DUF423 domain-containing protein [Maribacter sp. 6B07]CAG2531677.1 TMEM256/DUF423 family [Maribacter dokdonensis]|tara:strand:+ start:347 stop:733 length:387 start_codon:yes stop_codon:yes gene_type:complete